MNKKIAILSGDGIGPEVMQAALRILDTIAKRFNHHFEYQEAAIGGEAFERYQTHCPEQTIEICEQADAILFGSVGGLVTQQQKPKWKNCEANSILRLRQHFELNINIRPIMVYPGLAASCPLKPALIQEGIDIVIFRELLGGLYLGHHEQTTEHGQRVARDECVYHEAQINSIIKVAFEAARLRNKRVCLVDKANVLATSKLWRAVASEVAKTYPDVQLTYMLVDNCAMQMIIHPNQFDVIVTENMFGDIISDLAAALPGSLGLTPSASLNVRGFGLYEPSGGSAPEIARRNIANPSAQILSAAMMLRYSFAMNEEAKVIEEAVKATIESGKVTKDLSGKGMEAVTTTEFTDAVETYLCTFKAV